MNFLLPLVIFTALSAVALALSFWLSLWLLHFVVKPRIPRYLLTAVLNAFFTPIGLGVKISGIHPLAMYAVIGLPVLALFYWLELRRESRQ